MNTWFRLLTLVGVSAFAASSAVAAPSVLQVGSWHGKQGAYTSVQSAVDAASPGDWVLIGPGSYKEAQGVRIATPDLHLRGMDRNGVVIDGARPGAATCDASPTAQVFPPPGGGRNGIEVVQVDGVSIENLTVCNFLGGDGGGGNQIWWNGGDGSGQIGMGPYSGAYLTASSSFFQVGTTSTAQYGIFVSNAKGPGTIMKSYASNMGDSSFYVGACADCNAVLRYVHAQNSPQGFSGSNSGGHLVLEDSEWDHNCLLYTSDAADE